MVGIAGVREVIRHAQRQRGGVPCKAARPRVLRAEAVKLFAEAGLRLIGGLAGKFALRQVECLKCGSPRKVSFRKVAEGSASLRWTCTYGIRPDEPHRIYLFHFADLRVFRVGITHSRHNGRLLQHQVSGGKLVESALVVDRSAALRIETVILAIYRPYAAPGIGPQQFPQRGWTETWSATDAPALSRPDVCRGAGLTETGDELRGERIFGDRARLK